MQEHTNGLSMPDDAWRQLRESVAQNSSRPVSWWGKAANAAPGHEGEELDVVFTAQYRDGVVWFSMSIPSPTGQGYLMRGESKDERTAFNELLAGIDIDL